MPSKKIYQFFIANEIFPIKKILVNCFYFLKLLYVLFHNGNTSINRPHPILPLRYLLKAHDVNYFRHASALKARGAQQSLDEKGAAKSIFLSSFITST